jgi:tripartite-type tricarboxylate transporter receptor subunit TctC
VIHRRHLLGVLPAVLASVHLGVARAQGSYPRTPINMIVAFGAGGGTDVIARLIARYIEKFLGNNAALVVQNKPGASGGIGFSALASAAPDGYTIGFINTPAALTIPIERKSTFTWKSFDLLGNIVDDPGNFSVRADSPIRSLKDLAAHAKANPGKVDVGTAGAGSDDHLAMLMFERAASVRMNHIPFKGGAEVHNALLGKTIDVAAMNIGEAMQYVKGGSALHQLGQMSLTRTSVAPNVPTFKEQGFEIVLSAMRGIAAPKGLPAPIREQLVRAIERAAADPDFQAEALAQFAPARYLPPARYEAELLEAEVDLRKLWTAMPWTDK